MNGQEQRQRATAIAQLTADFKTLHEEVTAAYSVEIEQRLKGQEYLKEVFAHMVDDETTFRKRAVREAESRLMEHSAELAQATMQFMMLPTWKRWGWVIFGGSFLVWVSGRRKLDPTKAVAEFNRNQAPLKVQYHGEKPS